MKRTQLNFAIDAAAFAAFLFLLSTGLLLRYQLTAGSGGLNAAGSGRGAAHRPITLLWGWTRHDWGQIHYWIAGLLIAILAVHLVLHWKWIICVVRGTRAEASGSRFAVGVVSLVALVLMAAAPLLTSLERVTRGELRQQQLELGPESATSDSTKDLRGSMTVAEVARATNLSVPEFVDAMGFPKNVGPNERIGRLLRQRGQQMSDLRRVLGPDESIAIKEREP
jgi:hypothetical protein